MKKITLVLVILLAVSMLFTGCQQEQASSVGSVSATVSTSEAIELSEMEKAIESLADGRGDGKVIGVVAFNEANDWNINAIAGVENYFEPLGYEVEVIVTNGDPAMANSAVDTYITKGVDGIVISGGEQTSLEPAAEKIVNAGIPFSCIDMFQDGAVISTMADNWGGGTQLGLWVLNKIEGEGKVLILDTPSWVTLLARADAADVVFNPFRSNNASTGIVTERYDIDAGNAVADSQTKVAAALAADTNNDIKAIITSWNLPAMGAYAAILDSGRDDIVIASGDTGNDVMLAMREESAPDWVFMGQGASELALRASQGLDLEINGQGDVVPFAMFGPTYFVSNSAEPFGKVMDGSIIKHQTPEEHWQEAFGRPYGN